jgi:hypothetical protein
MKFSSAKLRVWLRAFHLLGMMPLGLVIYFGGMDEASILLKIVRFVVFPSFALTGLIMWQLPRLNKILRPRL